MAIDLERKRYSLICITLSVLCHVAAFLQYRLKSEAFEIGGEFTYQFHSLLIVSFLLSLLLMALRRPSLILLVLVLRFIAFAMIGYPLADYLGIEFTLSIVLIFESSFYISYPYNIPLLAFLVLFTMLLQRPIEAWDKELAGPSVHNLISFCIYISILAFTCILLKCYIEILFEQRAHSRRLDEAVKGLINANIGFQQLAAVAKEQSEVNERKRVTREIHDTIGYTLTNVIMMMEAATDLLAEDSVQVREILLQARDQAQEGYNETRRALRLLRSEEAHKVEGLLAVHKLVKAFEKVTRIHVNVQYTDLPLSLGKEKDLIIYRLVQEGITNAFRHGKATEIRLYFWQDNSGIIVRMHDNGSGISEIKEGMGLQGMRERIEQLGGWIKTQRVVDGFELSAWLPW